MHARFFPLPSEDDFMLRKLRLLEEFGVYNEQMLVRDFMYLSDAVVGIRAKKKKCIEEGSVYLGS